MFFSMRNYNLLAFVLVVLNSVNFNAIRAMPISADEKSQLQASHYIRFFKPCSYRPKLSPVVVMVPEMDDYNDYAEGEIYSIQGAQNEHLTIEPGSLSDETHKYSIDDVRQTKRYSEDLGSEVTNEMAYPFMKDIQLLLKKYGINFQHKRLGNIEPSLSTTSFKQSFGLPLIRIEEHVNNINLGNITNIFARSLNTPGKSAISSEELEKQGGKAISMPSTISDNAIFKNLDDNDKNESSDIHPRFKDTTSSIENLLTTATIRFMGDFDNTMISDAGLNDDDYTKRLIVPSGSLNGRNLSDYYLTYKNCQLSNVEDKQLTHENKEKCKIEVNLVGEDIMLNQFMTTAIQKPHEDGIYGNTEVIGERLNESTTSKLLEGDKSRIIPDKDQLSEDIITAEKSSELYHEDEKERDTFTVTENNQLFTVSSSYYENQSTKQAENMIAVTWNHQTDLPIKQSKSNDTIDTDYISNMSETDNFRKNLSGVMSRRQAEVKLENDIDKSVTMSGRTALNFQKWSEATPLIDLIRTERAKRIFNKVSHSKSTNYDILSTNKPLLPFYITETTGYEHFNDSEISTITTSTLEIKEPEEPKGDEIASIITNVTPATVSLEREGKESGRLQSFTPEMTAPRNVYPKSGINAIQYINHMDDVFTTEDSITGLGVKNSTTIDYLFDNATTSQIPPDSRNQNTDVFTLTNKYTETTERHEVSKSIQRIGGQWDKFKSTESTVTDITRDAGLTTIKESLREDIMQDIVTPKISLESKNHITDVSSLTDQHIKTIGTTNIVQIYPSHILKSTDGIIIRKHERWDKLEPIEKSKTDIPQYIKEMDELKTLDHDVIQDKDSNTVCPLGHTTTNKIAPESGGHVLSLSTYQYTEMDETIKSTKYVRDRKHEEDKLERGDKALLDIIQQLEVTEVVPDVKPTEKTTVVTEDLKLDLVFIKKKQMNIENGDIGVFTRIQQNTEPAKILELTEFEDNTHEDEFKKWDELGRADTTEIDVPQDVKPIDVKHNETFAQNQKDKPDKRDITYSSWKDTSQPPHFQAHINTETILSGFDHNILTTQVAESILDVIPYYSTTMPAFANFDENADGERYTQANVTKSTISGNITKESINHQTNSKHSEKEDMLKELLKGTNARRFFSPLDDVDEENLFSDRTHNFSAEKTNLNERSNRTGSQKFHEDGLYLDPGQTTTKDELNAEGTTETGNADTTSSLLRQEGTDSGHLQSAAVETILSGGNNPTNTPDNIQKDQPRDIPPRQSTPKDDLYHMEHGGYQRIESQQSYQTTNSNIKVINHFATHETYSSFPSEYDSTIQDMQSSTESERDYSDKSDEHQGTMKT